MLRREKWLIISFLAPGLIVFSLVILLPSLMAVRMSFYKIATFIDEPQFNGLANFISIVQQFRILERL